MVELDSIISGSTSLLNVTIGLISGIVCIAIGKKRSAKLLYWAGGFLICMGTFYSGPGTSFVMLLLTDNNISPEMYIRLSYTLAPVGCALGMYVGWSFIYKKLRVFMTVIYLLTAPFFWYGLYWITNSSIEYVLPPADVLLDVSFAGWMSTLTAAYIGSFGLVLLVGYSWLAAKSSGIIKKRAMIQIFAVIFFVTAGAVDSLLPFSNYVAIVRVLMSVSYILFLLGYTITK